jgi:hypothetical protein
MGPHESTMQRWLADRHKLILALRDYEAGRMAHLAPREERHFVESLRHRIGALEEKLGLTE